MTPVAGTYGPPFPPIQAVLLTVGKYNIQNMSLLGARLWHPREKTESPIPGIPDPQLSLPCCLPSPRVGAEPPPATEGGCDQASGIHDCNLGLVPGWRYAEPGLASSGASLYLACVILLLTIVVDQVRPLSLEEEQSET